MINSSEVWRDIPGWNGAYQVSDQGRVRSVTRRIPGSRPAICATRVMPGRELRPTKGKNGYFTVALSAPGGRVERHYVHALVLVAFIGPRPLGLGEIRHLNGDKSRNWLSNLAYGTPKENADDRRAHGQLSIVRGEDSGMARLSDAAVLEIRERYAQGGISHRALAAEYGVGHATIGQAVRHLSWKHV